jgi:hypothetical protein
MGVSLTLRTFMPAGYSVRGVARWAELRRCPAPYPKTERRLALHHAPPARAAIHALEVAGRQVHPRPFIVAQRLPAFDLAEAVECDRLKHAASLRDTTSADSLYVGSAKNT